MLLPAQPNDHQQLTQLTKLSKAYWGYSEAQIAAWSEDLTISEAYITNNLVYKYVKNKQIVGYYSLTEPEENNIQLDNLFILPSKIGKGYGSLLLTAAIAKAKTEGYTTMTLYSDPHATAFYKKKGFEVIGQLPTSIPNRFLPIMTKQI